MYGSVSEVLHPEGYRVDIDLIEEFELGLDTIHPEANPIPCRVLGYGEISTVLVIERPEFEGLALKRVSVFRHQGELESYLQTYIEYNRILAQDAGVSIPNHGYCIVPNPRSRPILYLIQECLPTSGIANKLIHEIDDPHALELFQQILDELKKVWDYNDSRPDKQIAIDGQLSNWCRLASRSAVNKVSDVPDILYIDTSTPQMRLDGREQLDGELFLRSAPPVLAWLLRVLYMDEVMSRYYEPRNVLTDLIANFYKEKRADLIPNLIELANKHLEDLSLIGETPDLDMNAIKTYYDRDKSIWSLYLNSRRIDRFVRGELLRMDYPYILPGPVER